MIKIFRLLTVMFFILLIMPVTSSADDSSDYALHFGLSAIFGGISESFLHYNTELSAPKRIGFGTLMGSVPGLLKEVSDDEFSGSDMAANVAGAFIGSVISNYINTKIQVNVVTGPEKSKILLSCRF